MSLYDCEQCGEFIPSRFRECLKCEAPVSAARLSARRWKTARTSAIMLLLIAAAAGFTAWRSSIDRAEHSVKPSQHPYAPKLSLSIVYDESSKDLSGAVSKRVGVVMENRGETAVECLKLVMRVVDESGLEQRIERRELRCTDLGDPLWPGERAVTGFETRELEKSEHFEVLIEELTLGQEGASAPPLRPMTVSLSPELGVTDLSPFLTHELRSERLEDDKERPRSTQLVVFTVTALAPHEVIDLDYELHVIDASGQDSQDWGLASVARQDYGRLPALVPGKPVSVSMRADVEKVAPGSRWELRVTHFTTR